MGLVVAIVALGAVALILLAYGTVQLPKAQLLQEPVGSRPIALDDEAALSAAEEAQLPVVGVSKALWDCMDSPGSCGFQEASQGYAAADAVYAAMGGLSVALDEAATEVVVAEEGEE